MEQEGIQITLKNNKVLECETIEIDQLKSEGYIVMYKTLYQIRQVGRWINFRGKKSYKMLVCYDCLEQKEESIKVTVTGTYYEPKYNSKEYEIIDINEENYLTLLSMEGTIRNDMKTNSKVIRMALEAERTIKCSVDNLNGFEILNNIRFN